MDKVRLLEEIRRYKNMADRQLNLEVKWWHYRDKRIYHSERAKFYKEMVALLEKEYDIINGITTTPLPA